MFLEVECFDVSYANHGFTLNFDRILWYEEDRYD
jgi:hypothetical protein